jgi:hypothetical protein
VSEKPPLFHQVRVETRRTLLLKDLFFTSAVLENSLSFQLFAVFFAGWPFDFPFGTVFD